MTSRLIKKKHYKWAVVGACFIMIFVCLGFCSSTKGLYLSAITEALGIKRSLFSINDSCRFIATAVVNLFFGTLIRRFGPRKMIGAGFLSLTISMLIYSMAEHVYVFYIGGIFLGIGLAWTTTTMIGHVVNAWCKEHKGTIMGFVLAANGLGGAFATQIISPIIYDKADVFGYRTAYRITALVLLIVGTLVVLLIHDKPGYEAEDTKKKAKANAHAGLPMKELLRKPYFYATAGCVLLTGIVLQGVGGVSSAHMKDVGIDANYIATVVSVHSLALAGFKFLTGIIYDKRGLRFTVLLCDVAAIVTVISLLCLNSSGTGRILAMCYGVISSLALPLETIMLPLITSDLFGECSYAQLLGIIISLNTTGYAIGTPLTNLVYDICGSYRPIFVVFIAVMVFVTVCFQWIIRAEAKDRQATIGHAEKTES